MQEEDKVKVGDRVKTPDGEGVIINFDLPESIRAKRFCVKLDDNTRYHFNPCYWGKELEVIEKKT